MFCLSLDAGSVREKKKAPTLTLALLQLCESSIHLSNGWLGADNRPSLPLHTARITTPTLRMSDAAQISVQTQAESHTGVKLKESFHSVPFALLPVLVVFQHQINPSLLMIVMFTLSHPAGSLATPVSPVQATL